MKYKVGDKVVIEDLQSRKTKGNVNVKMYKHSNKVMTIREITGSSYHMMEDIGEHVGNGWYWDDSMIKGLAKPKVEFQVGDVVKLKSGKLFGDMVSLSEESLRSKLGKNLHLVEDVSVTTRLLVGGIYVSQENVELIARAVEQEDKQKSKNPEKYKWSEREIDRADSIAKHILLDLYDKGISPVFYISDSQIKVSSEFGHNGNNNIKFATCFHGDEFNEKIGKCVALCKLADKPIPKFILCHDDNLDSQYIVGGS